jgi:excisionase family DNA binding protein
VTTPTNQAARDAAAAALRPLLEPAAEVLAELLAPRIAALLGGAMPVAEAAPIEADADQMLTIAGVCELTGLSDDSIRLEVATGRLPSVRATRKAIRVLRRDLQKWIAERREARTVVPLRRARAGR